MGAPSLVMLSWRYIDHPQAGGAETATHEILRRMAARGWRIHCFTAAYPGAAPEGEIDGVKLVRRGRQTTVHIHAWRWLRRRVDEFDLVVEQMNTLPFLTPLYVPRDRRRLLIHQLAREYWWSQTRGLFKLAAPFGYLLEPVQLKCYRRTRTITISRSSREDLRALGIADVRIIPMAIERSPVGRPAERDGGLRVIALGRLEPAKHIEEVIEAFTAVQRKVPQARLNLVGDGTQRYRRRLERLMKRRKARDVTFHGRVSEERKWELLEAAHLHVFASHREGWGLTVTEAAAVGTPSVGYDVPGVRDSIGEPLLLARERTPAGLAERILELHADPELYARLRTDAWRRTEGMTWARAADSFVEAVR